MMEPQIGRAVNAGSATRRNVFAMTRWRPPPRVRHPLAGPMRPALDARACTGKQGNSREGATMTDAVTDSGATSGIAAVRAFITELPYAHALGLQLLDVGAGWAELAMPYRADLVGDPATGVMHGGAVSALMDTTCGAAVMSHPEAGAATATLDLRIDYMRGARPGQTVRARADCIRVTRTIAFVRATAHDDDPDTPIAMASGAFTVTRPEDGA